MSLFQWTMIIRQNLWKIVVIILLTLAGCWKTLSYGCSDQSGITIVTNKVALLLDLQTIKNYVKSANYIEAESVKVSCLPQSKSYLKIIGILYLEENTNSPIIIDVVEAIIKQNHIFNNISIVSRPCIIKISPKFNMAIIWLDIWDIQSSSRAKGLINRCFNIRSYIATICKANMNPGILQCKNCWKWGYATFSCRI